jgi:hypothetical protein
MGAKILFFAGLHVLHPECCLDELLVLSESEKQAKKKIHMKL